MTSPEKFPSRNFNTRREQQPDKPRTVDGWKSGRFKSRSSAITWKRLAVGWGSAAFSSRNCQCHLDHSALDARQFLTASSRHPSLFYQRSCHEPYHVFIIRVEQWLQVASRLCTFCQLRTSSRLLIGISNWEIRWAKAPLAKSTVRCAKLAYQSRSEHCTAGALNWATGETVAVKEITLSNIPKSELGEIMVRGSCNLFEPC